MVEGVKISIASISKDSHSLSKHFTSMVISVCLVLYFFLLLPGISIWYHSQGSRLHSWSSQRVQENRGGPFINVIMASGHSIKQFWIKLVWTKSIFTDSTHQFYILHIWWLWPVEIYFCKWIFRLLYMPIPTCSRYKKKLSISVQCNLLLVPHSLIRVLDYLFINSSAKIKFKTYYI